MSAKLKIRDLTRLSLLAACALATYHPGWAQSANETLENDESKPNAAALRPVTSVDINSLNLSVEAGSVLSFTVPKINQQLPIVRFGTQDLLVLDKSNEWQVIAAISEEILGGEYLIYFRYDSEDAEAQALPIRVRTGDAFVGRADSDSRLIGEWQTQWPRSLSALDFDNSSEPNLPFTAIIPRTLSEISTRVSKHRVEHTATALHATLNEPEILVAPSSAIVSTIENKGNQEHIMVLAHGREVYSIIAFTGEPLVAVGDGVNPEQALAALSGSASSARSITWWLQANNTLISPQHFIDW